MPSTWVAIMARSTRSRARVDVAAAGRDVRTSRRSLRDLQRQVEDLHGRHPVDRLQSGDRREHMQRLERHHRRRPRQVDAELEVLARAKPGAHLHRERIVVDDGVERRHSGELEREEVVRVDRHGHGPLQCRQRRAYARRQRRRRSGRCRPTRGSGRAAAAAPRRLSPPTAPDRRVSCTSSRRNTISFVRSPRSRRRESGDPRVQTLPRRLRRQPRPAGHDAGQSIVEIRSRSRSRAARNGSCGDAGRLPVRFLRPPRTRTAGGSSASRSPAPRRPGTDRRSFTLARDRVAGSLPRAPATASRRPGRGPCARPGRAACGCAARTG